MSGWLRVCSKQRSTIASRASRAGWCSMRREELAMRYTLRRGLAAGFLAGLVLALIDFVTDGAPGNNFPSVLHWFGINPANSTISHYGGFLLLIVLAGLFGLIFAITQRETPISASRALLWGLALGL